MKEANERDQCYAEIEQLESQLEKEMEEKEILINHIISMGNGYNREDVIQLLTQKEDEQ